MLYLFLVHLQFAPALMLIGVMHPAVDASLDPNALEGASLSLCLSALEQGDVFIPGLVRVMALVLQPQVPKRGVSLRMQ